MTNHRKLKVGLMSDKESASRMEIRSSQRRRMTGRERREQLLDIGRRLFAERGFEGTSIEEIAAQAGVSKPVVYEHFGGKEGLYAVVVDREVGRFQLLLAQADVGGDARTRIERLVTTWLQFAERDPDGLRILLSDTRVESETFKIIVDDLASQILPWVSAEFTIRGVEEQYVEAHTHMILGAIIQAMMWRLEGKKVELEKLAEQLTKFIWGGLSSVWITDSSQ